MASIKFMQDIVICFLHSKSRYEVLHELVCSLVHSGIIGDYSQFYNAIVKRESICSTAIGMGVAVPHAKLDKINNFFLAVGVKNLKNGGIYWDSVDYDPVRIVFMIGGPNNKQTEYLQILSKLTLMIRNERNRYMILNSESKEEIKGLFSYIFNKQN